MSKIQTFLDNILSSRFGKDVRQSIHDAIQEIDSVADTAQTSATAQAEAARKSAQSASNSASAAAVSEDNARTYMESANASATNAKASEEASKLSETNSKSSENNAKVSEEHAQAVFESLPEDYGTLSKEFYEVAIKQKASGEDIHTTDSSNAKVGEFALFGKARQQTTSGKNKFNTDNPTGTEIATYTKEKNSVTVSTGDTSSLGYGRVVFNIPLQLDKSYVLSFDTDSTAHILVGWYGIHKEIDEGGKTHYSAKFTGITTNSFSIGVRESNTTVKFSNIQIEEGEVETPWEEYSGGIASPNPQYPQNIEVPNGDVVVKSCGKNLLKNTATSKTTSGITFTVNDDKSVTVNGTASESVYLRLSEYTEMSLIQGFRYKLSGCPIGGSSNSYRFQIWKGTEANQQVHDYGGGSIFTFDETFTNWNIAIFITKGATINNLTFYPMLCIATDTDDTYQPYKETSFSIPTTDFAGIKVDSGGNYTDQNGQQWICDEIVKYADGSGEKVQNVIKYAINENTDIRNHVYNSDEISQFIVFIANTPKSNTGALLKPVCNILSRIALGDLKTKTGIALTEKSVNSVHISLPKTIASTVAEAKAKLIELGTVIYYPLAEPIITTLTSEEIAEIEKLSTFYPVTNISNDADCGMSVTYLCDSKNYIDSKIAELATAMVNSI